MSRFAILRAIRFSALAVGLCLAGCDAGPLKTGVSNWIPQSTGGPIETRPLPPAQRVYADYEEWLKSESVPKVRLYSLEMQNATNQLNYTLRVGRGDTPLGASDTTFVTSIYHDAANGEYQLEWMFRGRHQPDFLKVGTQPKKVLLQLFGTPDESPKPRLLIVAIEGVESRGLLVAEPGKKAQ